MLSLWILSMSLHHYMRSPSLVRTPVRVPRPLTKGAEKSPAAVAAVAPTPAPAPAPAPAPVSCPTLGPNNYFAFEWKTDVKNQHQGGLHKPFSSIHIWHDAVCRTAEQS